MGETVRLLYVWIRANRALRIQGREHSEGACAILRKAEVGGEVAGVRKAERVSQLAPFRVWDVNPVF